MKLKFLSFNNVYYLLLSCIIANLLTDQFLWAQYAGIAVFFYGLLVINHRLLDIAKKLEEVPTDWKPGQARVVCAACKDDKGRIVTGARHFDAIMQEQIQRSPDLANSKMWEQGFIDQRGRFLTRAEAYEIALDQKQILRRVGGDDGTLYSENLY